MPDPLAFEPLADGTDPWVLAITRTETKILNPDLSFAKYCQTTWGRAPKVFAHTSANSPTSPVFDPNIDDCPAVVIETTNAAPGQDRGAGNERWYFNLLVHAKFVVSDGDQTKAIRAFHELIRTVFRGWRTGTLDPLSTIGTGYAMLHGDLTPEFVNPRAGMLIARGGFGIRFTFAENILG